MSQVRFSDCCFLSIPKEGTRLIWEVTQYCPYSCEYCFTWSSPKREKFEADILKVMPKVEQLIENMGIKEVLLTGGEPLSVAREIVPVLDYWKQRGIPFSISTNLYDETIFNNVSRFRPRTVNLSFDPPSLKNVRSAFKANSQSLKAKLDILEAAGQHAKLTAVISRANYHNVPEFLEVIGDIVQSYHNIEKIAFNREYPVGFAAESEPQTKTELKQTVDSILKWSHNLAIPITLVNWSEFHAPLQSCPAGKQIVSIQQNGDVTPCSLLYNLTRSFRAGNLLRDPLDIIVNRLKHFAQDLTKYYEQTENNTPACIKCPEKGTCGGGCLAILPIASNHVPRRTCEKNPRRIKDHERKLLSDFHRKYHEVYSPESKKFVAPHEKLDKETERRIREHVNKILMPSDLAHTMEHVDAVVRMAKFISEREGASLRITIPAAYFHDAAPREAAMHYMHTYKSAALAKEYLTKSGSFTEDEITHIIYCIITSSYGSRLLGYRPLSLEAKVLSDADWLDAIGARGIARVFAFGQAHGAKEMGYPDYDPEELPITIDMNITGPDGSPIYHFFTKLLKISSLLQTATGRKLGEERHEFMVKFLRQYKKETDLKKDEFYQSPLSLSDNNNVRGQDGNRP